MPARKTPCLMANALKAALEHERIWLRSEDFPKNMFLQYYVDVGHIKSLSSNANHLVSGRRGTGKTHLLGAFKEYVNKSPERSFAIMISLLDVASNESRIPDGVNDDKASRIAARNQFDQMLRIFFDQFLLHISEFKKTLENTKENLVDNLLQELLTEVEVGSNFFTTQISREHQVKPEHTCDQSILLPTDSVHVESGNELEFVEDNITLENSKQNGSVDHVRVRSLVSRILVECEISLMHLLIDEWMELDKNTPSKIQNEYSQLLKKTFFNERHVSVVIASIWNQTSLYERVDMDVSSGIQIGHDIEHTVDLDTSFFDAEDQILKFCKKLLFLRLSKRSPELLRFELEDETIDDVFITDIFDTKTNFKIFVAASHGIPRELMKIFQKASNKISFDFKDKCICRDTIDKVARNIYRLEKRENISPGSTTKAMWTRINKHMYKTDNRVFLVHDGMQKTSSAFRALIDHELIHEIPSGALPRWIRSGFKAYFIDYGNYVDWKTTIDSSLFELVSESILPTWGGISQKDIKKMLVEVVPDLELYTTCNHCKNLNLNNQPAFKLHGFCLHCGLDPVNKKSAFK